MSDAIYIVIEDDEPLEVIEFAEKGDPGTPGAPGSNASVTNANVNTAIATNPSATRTALALGTAATKDTGFFQPAGSYVQEGDPRLTNARTPTAHQHNTEDIVDFAEQAANAAPVKSVNMQTGDVVIDAASIGLDQVENTSDADKPISSATQAALDEKASIYSPALSDAREWTASTVTQAEAEAGTATTRRAWTAQRVRQAIVAWWNTLPAAFRNFASNPTSDNFAALLTDENGTGGGFVRAQGASLTSPTIAGTLTLNATSYPYGTGAAAAHRAALNIVPLVDPEMIRGLQLKLAADDLQYQGLVAIANNDTVAAWRAPNKPLTTTAEIVFSQATAGSRPIYQTNIQNSLPGVFFDGVNDVMTSNAALMSLLGNNARTVFVVLRPTALASGGAGSTWNRPQVYSNAGQFNGLSVSPSGSNNILTAWDYDTTGVIKNVATAGVAPNTTVLLTQKHEKGVTSISLNQGTPVTASVLRNCTDVTTLQLGSNSAGSGFYQGYIFEILMYARVLTSTEIAVVETYLKTKWNV